MGRVKSKKVQSVRGINRGERYLYTYNRQYPEQITEDLMRKCAQTASDDRARRVRDCESGSTRLRSEITVHVRTSPINLQKFINTAAELKTVFRRKPSLEFPMQLGENL